MGTLPRAPKKGDSGCMIGVSYDVTERVRVEQTMRESESRLQAAVDLVRLGCYSWNPQTNELQWDKALKAMWGLPADAPVDYDVWRTGVHPDDLSRVEAAIQRCIDPQGDGLYDIEYRVIGKIDGRERWIATRGRTLFENNRPVSFYGIALDITDRKRIQSTLERRDEARTRELEEANRQLRSQIEQRKFAETTVRQLQRLEAVGQITSGVAHDFNNLLSVVLINTLLLLHSMRDQEDQEGLELIRSAAERGAKLTEQLLAFSRKQQLEPQLIDLNSKIIGMADLLSVTLGDTVHLKTTFTPNLWPALVDPTQIELVVLNLSINARDAMESGGTLTIETSNVVIEGEPSRPEEPVPGDYVGMAISDTGVGIPDDILPRVFEPYFSTKQPGKGSGLGLSQVFGFSKQSGGGVRIETRIGEGTSVKVFLPRAQTAAIDQEKDSSPATLNLQTKGGSNILVVDDDKSVLRSTIRMLDFLGYAATPAQSAKEALRLIASELEIDLVLADVAMPDMNGVELAQSNPRYPVRFARHPRHWSFRSRLAEGIRELEYSQEAIYSERLGEQNYQSADFYHPLNVNCLSHSSPFVEDTKAMSEAISQTTADPIRVIAATPDIPIVADKAAPPIVQANLDSGMDQSAIVSDSRTVHCESAIRTARKLGSNR
jgi:PAS domain S-box-containing protein